MAVQIQAGTTHSMDAVSVNFEQEHQDLMIASGQITQAQSIKNCWMKSEESIRSIIKTLKESDLKQVDLEPVIKNLTKEAALLEELFFKIKEITKDEPTFCKIKRSFVLAVGGGIGITSGTAGMGTIIHSYIQDAGPNLAPVLLTALGVASLGFQTFFWKKIKRQEEDRVSLVALGSRHGIITDAKNIARLLRKIPRTNDFNEVSDFVRRIDHQQGVNFSENSRWNVKELISSMRIAKIYPTMSNPVKSLDPENIQNESQLSNQTMIEINDESENSDGVEIFPDGLTEVNLCVRENPRENFVIELEEVKESKI